jgi:hypothetical protein
MPKALGTPTSTGDRPGYQYRTARQEAPHINDHGSTDREGVLTTISGAIGSGGIITFTGQATCLSQSAEHATIAAGVTQKRMFRVFEHARVGQQDVAGTVAPFRPRPDEDFVESDGPYAWPKQPAVLT